MKKKNNISQNVRLIISIVSFALTSLLLVVVILAWFATNQVATVTGIVASSNTSSAEIRDLMEVKRYMSGQQVSDKYYHCGSNKIYYEWDIDNEEYILDDDDNKIPMEILSVFPYEYVDIQMWYYAKGSARNGKYSIGLSGFDDSEGIFTETIEGVDYTHSALGVFRVSELALNEDDEFEVSEDGWHWFARYNGDTVADTKYSTVIFKNGDFSQETTTKIGDIDYYTTTFRIEMNLTQYQELEYTSTNMLSEKTVTVGQIRLIV